MIKTVFPSILTILIFIVVIPGIFMNSKNREISKTEYNNIEKWKELYPCIISKTWEKYYYDDLKIDVIEYNEITKLIYENSNKCN